MDEVFHIDPFFAEPFIKMFTFVKIHLNEVNVSSKTKILSTGCAPLYSCSLLLKDVTSLFTNSERERESKRERERERERVYCSDRWVK